MKHFDPDFLRNGCSHVGTLPAARYLLMVPTSDLGHADLRLAVWGSEPQNPKVTFRDPEIFSVI